MEMHINVEEQKPRALGAKTTRVGLDSQGSACEVIRDK